MPITNSNIPDIKDQTSQSRQKAEGTGHKTPNTNPHPPNGNGDILDDLEQLRAFTGPPTDFWMEFIRVCTLLTDSESGLLVIREENDDKWKTLCLWPPGNQAAVRKTGIRAAVNRVADIAADEGYAWEAKEGLRIVGIRLELGEEKRFGVAVVIGRGASEKNFTDVIVKLRMANDLPHVYQLRREKQKAREDVVGFVEALDLMVLLNNEKRYLAAAMTLCNEINSRFDCSRVSLGWLKKGYVRVQAISHMERFEKKMDAIQNLEAAMEEAFDQDEEILLPKDPQRYSITKDHERFAMGQGVQYLLSLPIRQEGEPVGVVTCERELNPFDQGEVNGLRLICDQATQRIADLKAADRWFGARAFSAAKKGIGKVLGVEHTFAKLLGICLCGILAFMILGSWPYRIEAPFMLKTDDLAYIPAPFDGYIQDVPVQVGDRVEKNALLLTLDDRELLLEESSGIADRTRYEREAKKSKARDDLAEMRIATALKNQTEAKLELIRYHLANSQLRAPFAGVVVEGELKELMGAPVRKGDVLFKVAKIENMYAVLDVDERDVHEIGQGLTGEIAFVSRPELKFPISVDLLEPVAVTKEEGNVFPVRCRFTGEVETWWRPGMSGIAKIDVGQRNILWIFTHRTVDFFRLFLWW